jgi:hypothetical protein
MSIEGRMFARKRCVVIHRLIRTCGSIVVAKSPRALKAPYSVRMSMFSKKEGGHVIGALVSPATKRTWRERSFIDMGRRGRGTYFPDDATTWNRNHILNLVLILTEKPAA